EYQDTMVRLAGVEEELVRLGKLDEEQQVKLALARQQANDKFQRAVELNQSQKGPLEELLESMQLEIDLLGMGNAERITELELLRLIDEYRRRGIELSQEEIDAARERIRSKVDEVDALREQISALDQFRDSFEDNVTAVLDGSKSIKDAIRDLVNDFIAQMLRMAAHNFTEALFGQMGTPGGGLFGNALGGFFDWFGGPRADGGPVSPGKAYLVGEQGPELFVPRSSGYISSNVQTRRAMGGQTVVNNFHMPGRYDLRTQAQVAADAARAANRAARRSIAA